MRFCDLSLGADEFTEGKKALRKVLETGAPNMYTGFGFFLPLPFSRARGLSLLEIAVRSTATNICEALSFS